MLIIESSCRNVRAFFFVDYIIERIYNIPMSEVQISFDPEKHRYFDNLGREYMSITTFIKQGEPEFDGASVAAKVIKDSRSKYYGMKKEDVLRQWNNAAPLGTELHESIEDYINTKKITDNPDIKPAVEQFAKLKFRGKLLSETVVFDPEYLVAGTVDLLEDCGNQFFLYDLKTSVTRPNGKDISQDKLHKFSLQLECYKRLVEKQFGKPCKIICVLWFKNFAKDKSNTKLELLKVDKVVEEVDKLFKYRKLMIGE